MVPSGASAALSFGMIFFVDLEFSGDEGVVLAHSIILGQPHDIARLLDIAIYLCGTLQCFYFLSPAITRYTRLILLRVSYR